MYIAQENLVLNKMLLSTQFFFFFVGNVVDIVPTDPKYTNGLDFA